MKRKMLGLTVGLLLLFALCAQAAFAAVVCQQGDKGANVRVVQTRLNTLGFLPSSPEEPYRFDPVTRTAVKKFQASYTQLPDTGVVDEQTFAVLKLSTAVTYDQYKDMTHVKGGSGEEVKQTKTRLKKLGYFTGALTEKYDDAMVNAVSYFQRAHGLLETGNANTATRKLMFSTQAVTAQEYKQSFNLTVVKKGDKNDQVTVVQKQLSELGFYTDAINGSYGVKTVSAVKTFQQANSLVVNGVANEVTRSVLNSGDAKSFSDYTRAQSVLEVRRGDKGYSVELLQARLKELAYYNGKVNGQYTDAVVSSVKRFQLGNSVNVSGSLHGVATVVTREAMNAAGAISRYGAEGLTQGDSGEEVRKMTSALVNLGYMTGSTDQYTAAVVTAVKMFQTANGLTATGDADRATLEELYSGDAISYDEFKMGTGNAKIEKVIKMAMNHLGKPYKSPCVVPASFDCSNYTRYILGKMNISLSGEVTRQALDAAKRFTKIATPGELKRGDLVYFDTQGSKPIGHAGIYLGKSNGTPRFIHASSARAKVVVSEVSDWYLERFVFGVRIWK